MIKTIQIGDKSINFSTSFAWCFIYKAQFGKDPLTVIRPAYAQASSSGASGAAVFYDLYERLGVVEVSRIAWAMARNADKEIPDPETWVSSFEEFPVMTFMEELIPEALSSMFATKKASAPNRTERRKARTK